MRITSVAATDLFTGPADRPLQLVRVRLVNDGHGVLADERAAVTVHVRGRDVDTVQPAVITGLAPGGEATADVPVRTPPAARPGTAIPVQATASWPGGSAELAAEMTVAEPGWTMWMVSHFHYDPVWWSTQGQFLESRVLLPDEHGELPEVRTAFELVRLHLDMARRDPDYKFVLAELDYLKPHFDAHPEDRADLLDFIRAGRIELVGGSYNEPNTNLTCAESTIRNAVFGIAYQRDVLGGNPRTSWMLDAFGFDPGYPGIMAAAGLTDSAWARGPFHQWGPRASAGDNRLMQFASEFEWLSPDGTGLLTAYMPNHYSAGWLAGYHAKDLATAEADAYEQFSQLAPVAATRNVLLPVGGDHTIPPRWATAIHRDWNARYTWPRFVTAVPSEFFGAVRAEVTDRDIWITPQTRDMNPVYTGKDVTYIDTKQAQRAAEVAVLDGERLATLAWLAGAPYPGASLDKAWRQLVFGAHHDAITGSEGDQVYLDLLGGWREAWERGNAARAAAVTFVAGLADTAGLAHSPGEADTAGSDFAQSLAVVVVNSLSGTRSAMATIDLDLPPGWPGWLSLHDDSGARVPFLAEGVRATEGGALQSARLTFRAAGVPGVGYRSYLVRPAAGPPEPGWQPVSRPEHPGDTVQLENDFFVIEADPVRGGTLARVLDKRIGAELLQAAGGGNELVLQPEHPAHPRWAEGPWLLCPAGPGTGTTARPADVRAERCAVGSRLVVTVELSGLQVTQETVLWDGADRVEFRTHVDGSIGQDRLLRVVFPAEVPGGLPVYQTAVAVVGRPPGPIDSDVAEHPYTLDCPASEWLAVGSTATIRLTGPDGSAELQAIGVAEVVAPPLLRGPARNLMAALAAQGVTATCSQPGGPRYGYSELDSNLPDFRICLGGPAENVLTAEVLAAAGPQAGEALAAQLAADGAARLWLPATRSRADAFGAGTDLRGPLDLPVLVVAATDLDAEVARLAADLADAVIEVPRTLPGPAPTRADAAGGATTALAGLTVGLLNRGTPSGLVTPAGHLTMALMRACSTWPSGVWIDGKKRTCPDGTSFSWQHWSHTFEYALMAGAGDWRTAGFAAAGQDYNHDLLTVATGLHTGPLPASTQLASVEPATVVLSALKPHGNPLYPGRPPDAAGGVTARLRDIGGTGPVPAHLSLFAGLTAARASSLCEDSTGADIPVEDGKAIITVPQAGLSTIVVTPASSGPLQGCGTELPPVAALEPVQPVYARYWLHGKGPAPAGNVPVAVHLSPGLVTLDAGQTAALRLTVACGTEPAAGAIRLEVPDGIVVTSDGPLGYDLKALGHQTFDLTVAARPHTTAGRRFITAQIDDPCGQVIEDSALVAIGQPLPPSLSLPLPELVAMQEAADTALAGEIDLSLISQAAVIRPGGLGTIEVQVRNRTQSAIRGEAQLISPYGSWQRAGPWTTGLELAAGAEDTLRFTVTVPATARPGEQWWAIVKVMYFGRLQYSEPVEVTVR